MNNHGPKKILLVINADTAGKLVSHDRRQERLTDYAALKKATGGDILDWNDLPDRGWRGRLVRLIGRGASLTVLAWRRRKTYDLVYCDSENNGLPLAALLKFSRARLPLMMIGHWITPAKKRWLIRILGLQSVISRLFVHATPQYEAAINDLKIPASRVQLLPYQVDTQFWQPQNARPLEPAPDRPFILTAGLEYRDYPTLIEAVRGLPVDLRIAASSIWSKRDENASTEATLPPNVSFGRQRFNYVELRDLYAACLFVVVPLQSVNFQAGITLILEAMAMGKPVIVSRSLGQLDTVIGSPPDPSEGRFVQLYGSSELGGPTGCYVPTGDPVALRGAIQDWLDHPDGVARLGAQARRTVERVMDVEQFATRIHRAIQEVLPTNVPVEADQEELSLKSK